MTIELYTGTPGSGKSLHMAEQIRIYTRLNRPVITNFEVNRHPKTAPWGVYDSEVDSPIDLVKTACEYWKTSGNRFREDYILLCLDECQLIFNSRTWNAKDRKDWIRFLTQHRKYGYKIILCTQFDQMVDKQIRSLVEHQVIHRKVSNMGFVASCLSALTFGRLFVAVYTFYGMNMRLRSEFFLRLPWNQNIYDTHKTWEPPDWQDFEANGEPPRGAVNE